MTTIDIFCHWAPPDYGAAALQAARRPDRLLFATDMPFGPEQGAAHIRESIANVRALPLNEGEREAVLHRNVERLLGWRRG
jgi:predicted TIM-barrel fold metal-dependent hydrolase